MESSAEDVRRGADISAALSPRSVRPPTGVRLRVGIGAVAVLGVVALIVTVLVSMAGASGSTSTEPRVSITSTARARAGEPSPSPSTAQTFVHVLGAVARPGLYPLGPGSRVVDAVAAAGGFTADANQGGVNLARPVVDGEQLVVPAVGEPVPQTSAPAGAASAPAGKLDLNAATAEQLETLPRVGPALSARILQWRTENGRFTSVDDLLEVPGIGEKTLDGFRELVTI
jgi:competence protein ComEA